MIPQGTHPDTPIGKFQLDFFFFWTPSLMYMLSFTYKFPLFFCEDCLKYLIFSGFMVLGNSLLKWSQQKSNESLVCSSGLGAEETNPTASAIKTQA